MFFLAFTNNLTTFFLKKVHSKLLTSEMYQKFYCSQVELVTQVKSFNTIGKIKGTSWKCTSLVKKSPRGRFSSFLQNENGLGSMWSHRLTTQYYPKNEEWHSLISPFYVMIFRNAISIRKCHFFKISVLACHFNFD